MSTQSYHGLCSVCGSKGEFLRGDQRSLRESFACPSCRFTLRWRDQASIIIDEFGRGQAQSLDQLVSRGLLKNIDIFEPALRGPFVQRLAQLPGYVQSYFWPDRECGKTYDAGVRNEDLTNLTFDDDSFDLVITSDVMEHLYDIEAAFSEINRVLRPGGIHVFTIPNDYPFPDKTTKRVAIEDGKEIHLKPANYHNSGDGSKCLVYTDYGADVVDMVDAFGAQTTIVRRSGAIDPCYTNATFVTRKLVPAGNVAPAPRPGRSATTSSTEPDLKCPVCDGVSFEPFNGRVNARCSTCRSVERNRLMWMIFEKSGVFEPDKRTLHLAPEYGVARRLVELSGDKYYACDFDAARYKSKLFKVHKLDLCHDLFEIPDNSYDLIIHSHVLEHIACDVPTIMREMDRILAPGGKHFLSVPIRGEITAEDMSDDLTDTHRLMMFGQEDHMRIFGATSLRDMLADIWGPGDHLIEPLELLGSDALVRAAIPRNAWSGISSHSIFGYTKAKEPQPEQAQEVVTVTETLVHGVTFKQETTGIVAQNVGAQRTATFRWMLDTYYGPGNNRTLVDLGAGPCLFARIAADRGFDVTAVDARTVRVPDDLGNVKFVQSDIRDFDTSGFEIVLMLGLFYHLTLEDQLQCLNDFAHGQTLILDTQIHIPDLVVEAASSARGVSATGTVDANGYSGVMFNETDNPMASVGNDTSFWATEPSLIKMFADTGFSDVTAIDSPYQSAYGGRRWYMLRK